MNEHNDVMSKECGRRRSGSVPCDTLSTSDVSKIESFMTYTTDIQYCNPVMRMTNDHASMAWRPSLFSVRVNETLSVVKTT